MFSEQITIFQEGMSVHHQTDNDFPGAVFWLPNRYQFSRSTFLVCLFIKQITIFQEQFFWLPNRYQFSRSTFLVTERDTDRLARLVRFQCVVQAKYGKKRNAAKNSGKH